jgi:hypothetical protein
MHLHFFLVEPPIPVQQLCDLVVLLAERSVDGFDHLSLELDFLEMILDVVVVELLLLVGCQPTD